MDNNSDYSRNRSNEQQPQPQVYNINKNDFQSIVQQLTGSPSRQQSQEPLPRPPMNSPKPPSNRLHRIRPSPLTPLNVTRPRMPMPMHHPPPPQEQMMPHRPPVSNLGRPPHNGQQYGNQRPLPPMVGPPQNSGDHPGWSNTAESPISAYMRYLQHSIVDSAQGHPQGASPRTSARASTRTPARSPSVSAKSARSKSNAKSTSAASAAAAATVIWIASVPATPVTKNERPTATSSITSDEWGGASAPSSTTSVTKNEWPTTAFTVANFSVSFTIANFTVFVTITIGLLKFAVTSITIPATISWISESATINTKFFIFFHDSTGSWTSTATVSWYGISVTRVFLNAESKMEGLDDNSGKMLTLCGIWIHRCSEGTLAVK
ncbi:hydroxyproline-rich glycoprotein family protein [Artemisia annua]|uniref:Hydroxyproline-rich glycoprotein family protein n=1 Tax=Artemisia annua TaxID=35608 RepID=A0A2U1MHH2_ARTAN|nr:hydroxyproline-rich glycoprotein family protein [Artemisia annua]